MYELMVDQWPEVGDDRPVMIIGLTGWMDGGHVSTATVGFLRERLAGKSFGEIDPLDFYIFHFPVSSIPISVYLEDGRAIVQPVNPMEFTAVFRPHARIEDGIIRELEYPDNVFSIARTPAGTPDLVLLSGEEPHIRWGAYCDCIFGVCQEMGIKDIYFVGSVASPVPHTREPRIRASMADEKLKPKLAQAGLMFGEYEGPSSIITSLTYHSTELGINMRSLVVEIPHYPFLDMPTYPRSILKTASTLSGLLGLELDMSELEAAAAEADGKLDALMEENQEFRELVAKLEEAYEYEETPGDERLIRRLIDSIDLEEGGGQE
ncbi:MAG: PAC2 family protein [Armatimonadota bacterium]|jgi:proteasome assembly chaperone (PAC2) family protein